MERNFLKKSIESKIRVPNNYIIKVNNWNNFLHLIKIITPPEVQFVLLLGLIENVMGKSEYCTFDDFLFNEMKKSSSYNKEQISNLKVKYNKKYGCGQKIREFFMNYKLISYYSREKLIKSIIISKDLNFNSTDIKKIDYKNLINIFIELRNKFVHSCYGIPFWNEKKWSEYYIQSIELKNLKNKSHFIKNKLSNEQIIKIIEKGLITKIITDIEK